MRDKSLTYVCTMDWSSSGCQATVAKRMARTRRVSKPSFCFVLFIFNLPERSSTLLWSQTEGVSVLLDFLFSPSSFHVPPTYRLIFCAAIFIFKAKTLCYCLALHSLMCSIHLALHCYEKLNRYFSSSAWINCNLQFLQSNIDLDV